MSQPSFPLQTDVRARIARIPARATSVRIRPAATLENDNMIGLAMTGALAVLVVHLGLLHQLITALIGFSFYLVWVVTILALAAAVLNGALGRTFGSGLGKRWLGFFVCMSLASAFSTWKTDSVRFCFAYAIFTFSLLPVIGGVPATLKNAFRLMGAVAWGGLLTIFSSRFFAEESEVRTFGFGSLRNANDVAAHILAVLPFMVFLFFRTRSILLRILMGGAIINGLLIGSRSGSRGALLALGAALLVLFFKIPVRYKTLFVLLIPVIGLVLVRITPQSTIDRYTTLWGDTSAEMQDEAEASREAREYLLRTSISMTFDNPLFGVGPNQFANVEGGQARESGVKGAWQNTHNAYTQVSSENGLPAFFFYVSAIVMTWRLLSRTERMLRGAPKFRHALMAAGCIKIALVGFAVATFFLSLAYTVYFPVFSGLALTLNRAVQRELAVIGEQPV